MSRTAFDPANSRRYRRISLSLTFLLLVAVAIIALSPAQTPIMNVENDKLGHIVAFTALSMPCALAHPRSLFWLLPLIILFGIAIELIQPYVGRTSDLSDVYADILGASLGTGGGLGTRWIGSRLCNGSVLG
jgi:VanZ family protein